MGSKDFDRPSMLSEAPVRRFLTKPHQLTSRITPTDDIFTLAVLGVPDIAREDWTLDIDGLVEHPLHLTFEALKTFPVRETEAFHQCAGIPTKWDLPTRRITNVVWRGVLVSDLLKAVGAADDADFLWAYGADHGRYDDEHVETYLKDMPLGAVRDTGAMVVFEINGQPLKPEHGYPVRLVVPGFYGTCSVKWLYRLQVATKRAEGLFVSKLYNDPAPTADNPKGTKPVWDVAPESVIVTPAPWTEIERAEIEVWGWAWARHGIAKVEVSTDGGGTWALASVEESPYLSWQRFSTTWRPSAPEGEITLMSRATDARGEAQPETGARNAIHSVKVKLRASETVN